MTAGEWIAGLVNVAAAIADLVKQENASLVVLGRRREDRWRRLLKEPMADRLVHLLENVDVYLIETKDER